MTDIAALRAKYLAEIARQTKILRGQTAAFGQLSRNIEDTTRSIDHFTGLLAQLDLLEEGAPETTTLVGVDGSEVVIQRGGSNDAATG